MPCLLSKDQPIRVQLSKNGVIHAGNFYRRGPYTSYDYNNRDENGNARQIRHKASEVLKIACSWKELSTDKIVSNKNKITCQNCMKKMGMVEGAVFPDRFVVRRKDTGEFFKNTHSRCSAWSQDVSDAFLYKRQADAEKQAKAYHYIDENGEVKGNWYGAKYAEKRNWRRVDNPNSKYEVKKVKITLED